MMPEQEIAARSTCAHTMCLPRLYKIYGQNSPGWPLLRLKN
jgi:hypothetical protein